MVQMVEYFIRIQILITLGKCPQSINVILKAKVNLRKLLRIILCRTGELRIAVHKVVLAATCKSLKFAEDQSFLELNDVSEGALHKVIKFIYTGCIDIGVDGTNNEDILFASKLLGVTELLDALMKKTLKSYQDDENLLDSYETIPKEIDFIQNELMNQTENESTDETAAEKTFEVKVKDARKVYDCDLCNKHYTSRYHLTRHKISHSDDREHCCMTCGKLFKSFRNLIIHERTHSLHRPFKCSVCSKSFKTPHALTSHKSLHKDRKYICEICAKTFTLQSRLNSHYKIHQQNGDSSETAAFDFSSSEEPEYIPNSDLTDVEKEPFVESKSKGKEMPQKVKKLFHCDYCNKFYSSNAHLERHKLTHTGERKHCCTTCGKLFMMLDHLTRHEETHSKKRTYKCSTCEMTFKTKSTLANHLLTHANEKRYICEICAKRFTKKSTLKYHLKSHALKDEKAKCRICNKEFTRRAMLLKHEKLHIDTLPDFGCDKCGKRFSTSSYLKKHIINVHSDVHLHCETCGKQFNNTRGLMQHQKMHTGIGLYHCTFCDKKFTTKRNQERHMKVHTGEKPFKCGSCEKQFSRSDALVLHQRTCKLKDKMKLNHCVIKKSLK